MIANLVSQIYPLFQSYETSQHFSYWIILWKIPTRIVLCETLFVHSAFISHYTNLMTTTVYNCIRKKLVWLHCPLSQPSMASNIQQYDWSDLSLHNKWKCLHRQVLTVHKRKKLNFFDRVKWFQSGNVYRPRIKRMEALLMAATFTSAELEYKHPADTSLKDAAVDLP